MPDATHLLHDVDPYAITICRKGANGHRIFLKKEHGDGGMTLPAQHMLIKEGGDEWTTFYCVVAEPGAVENGGQGAEEVWDVWRGEDDIRKAAHRFAANRGYVNAMHGAMAEQGCLVVENAVALADFEVDGHTIRKGSWYMAVEATPEFRAKVDAGEITGVSIEGTGLREAVAKAASFEGADKCSSCGSKVAKDASTCPNCGAKSPVHKQELTDDELVEHVEKVKSSVYPSLERKPGKQNWVDRAGGLPSYIERIAKHLHYEKGMSIGQAIASAVNTVKRWARGGGGVSAETQAKAQKALAEWERKKAKGKVSKEDDVRGFWRTLGQRLGVLAKDDGDDEYQDDDPLTDEELELLRDASPVEPGTLGHNDPAEEDDEVDQETKDRVEKIEKAQADSTAALNTLADLVRDLSGKITERKKDDEDKPTADSVKKALDEVVESQGTLVQALAKVASDVDALSSGGSGQHDDAERTRVEKQDEPWYAGIL